MTNHLCTQHSAMSHFKQRLTDLFRRDLFGATPNHTFSLREAEDLEASGHHRRHHYGAIVPRSQRATKVNAYEAADSMELELRCVDL